MIGPLTIGKLLIEKKKKKRRNLFAIYYCADKCYSNERIKQVGFML